MKANAGWAVKTPSVTSWFKNHWSSPHLTEGETEALSCGNPKIVMEIWKTQIFKPFWHVFFIFFYFERVLRLTKSYKNSTEHSHLHFPRLPPITSGSFFFCFKEGSAQSGLSGIEEQPATPCQIFLSCKNFEMLFTYPSS